MPRVFIPPGLRSLTGGLQQTDVEGETVRQVISNLEARFPGCAAQLLDGTALRPGWTVVVGGSVAALGLLQRVPADAEVHFLPALGGG